MWMTSPTHVKICDFIWKDILLTRYFQYSQKHIVNLPKRLRYSKYVNRLFHTQIQWIAATFNHFDFYASQLPSRIKWNRHYFTIYECIFSITRIIFTIWNKYRPICTTSCILLLDLVIVTVVCSLSSSSVSLSYCSVSSMLMLSIDG